jgi:predicted ATPase
VNGFATLGCDAVIRTPDQRLRVFVSSTLQELADERQAVSRGIAALRLTPVMFELGARPHLPRDLYRAYLAQSDIFIGLYWQRYGQPAAGIALSGLEEEFELSDPLPRLLYVKVPAPERDPRLERLLAKIEQEASYRTFRTPAELGRLVRDDIATLLSERFAAARRAAHPAPATARRLAPLPTATTSLVGREQAIDELVALVGRPHARLVTLTGPSGIGKTRLALAVSHRLRDGFDAGTAFVALESVTESDQLLASIGRAVGTDVPGPGATVESVSEHLGDGRWLLILDNLEQVLGAGRDLDVLLAGCPGVAVLATSLTAMGLRAEREYPVPPLAVPTGVEATAVADLAALPSVALFVDRAMAVRPDFALTAANAASVAEICRRLEGVPLAIELAAARTRLLDPDALLGRLVRSLDALGEGPADLPERQQTLRATVEWSIGLLDEAERSMLEVAAVFVDGWTLEAAAAVAAVDEDGALELSEALARHSLTYVEMTRHGPRSRMLETIRKFVAERTEARPDARDLHRRHADHYRALAEQGDRPLRTFWAREWAERLEAEAGNLDAAVRWYVAADPAPLPHLFRVLAPFRVLWPFWGLCDAIMGETRSWVAQLLPGADGLLPHDRAELLWTAAVIAVERSDEAAAVSARDRLAPLLDGLGDAYLRAVGELAVAWTSGLVGDVDRALGDAARSLEHLRLQDEPLWTALALLTLGALETVAGRHDDALAHLTEVHDLTERFDNPWLDITSLVELGTLALATGRFADAWDLLDEALDLSMAVRSTHNLASCLTALARLTLADGDPERAAVVAGAADGLRRRAGLRVWWGLRRDSRVVAEIRAAVAPERFDAAFAAGSHFDRHAAVAAARDGRAPARRQTRRVTGPGHAVADGKAASARANDS